MATTAGTLTQVRTRQSRGSQVWYVLRRWPVLPIIVLSALVITAVLAPWVAPHNPIDQNLRMRAAAPFWSDAWYEENPRVTFRYILGGDHVGRDVLSRIIHGARISLMVAGISLTTGLIIGSTLGLVAGYYGGSLWDEIIMRLVDVWASLPFLLIAILAAVVFRPSLTVVLVLLTLLAWSGGVRNVRAEVLTLRTREYVMFSRIAGASTRRILLRHMLPGVVNTIVVLATLRVGGLILAEASLSFLGAGIPPPTPAWGLMISEGREYLEDAWWIAVFPGIAIFLVVMSVNFLGDWLRDRLDPRLRQLG